MRIVITSPPKMGNKWLKCLLGTIYELDWLLGGDTPATNPTKFREWVESGKFADDSIFHQHCRYSPKMVETIESVPARVVTIIRDPYDAFVSMYYWLQSRAAHDQARHKVRPKTRRRDSLIGKPLDDPAVLTYLADGFAEHINRAVEWTQSGRAVVTRYEELHRDPVAELKRVTDQIEPVDEERIKRAIITCRADNMRQMSEKMATHIRSAKVGDSRERLGEPQLAIFRRRFANQLRALGYDVR